MYYAPLAMRASAPWIQNPGFEHPDWRARKPCGRQNHLFGARSAFWFRRKVTLELNKVTFRR